MPTSEQAAVRAASKPRGARGQFLPEDRLVDDVPRLSVDEEPLMRQRGVPDTSWYAARAAQIVHLRGCPLSPQDPDPAFAGRWEAYEAVGPRHRRVDGMLIGHELHQIARCLECGEQADETFPLED